MGWIKRNLFFVIGLLIAVLLLAGAGFYDFQSWRANQDAIEKLNEISSQIEQDNNYHPSPGNAQTDNIQIAKDQIQQLQKWLIRTRDYFQPIAPIPNPPDGQVSSEMFAPALSQTVRQLQKEAQDANVELPPQYYFSFTAQSDKAVFDSSTLGQVAQQLGDVRSIVEILFGARINELEGIQRLSISKDDVGGQQSDYLLDQPITSNSGLGVLTPYQVTFRGFSSDIANVLAAFASSPHGFIVQTISVQPASETAAMEGGGQAQSSVVQGGPNMALYNRYQNQNAPPAAMQAPASSRGELQTVLNEQMLRVTLKVQIIKLTPSS
jgi:hypothetical protein